MNDDSIIELCNVTLSYGATTALADLTLSVGNGEYLCVLGANGSGKSTLASVMAGLLAPDAGSVSIVGHTVRSDEGGVDFAAYAEARRHVGLVLQNPDDQIVTTVVADDVAFGPENLCVPASEIGERVSSELDRVAMGAYAMANPASLSGGQKQRVAIAGALAMRPDVLVLDEPGALLDVRGRRGIMRVMGELHAGGTTIVHVTHFMDEALAADRVIVLDGGRVVLAGTPGEVFAHGDKLAALSLELPFAARVATRLRDAGIDVPFTCGDDELVSAIARRFFDERTTGEATVDCPHTRKGAAGEATVGHTTAGQGWDGTFRPGSDADGVGNGCDVDGGNLPPLGTTTDATGVCGRLLAGGGSTDASATNGATGAMLARAAIDVRGVTYSYADAGSHGHHALAGVGFRVMPGSHVAIVGHTGSGKSTLLRLLSALTAPDTGTITIGDISTATRRGRRSLLGHVGYVMQHPERQLFAETVGDDVAFGPRNLGLNGDEVETRVDGALALVGLTGRRGDSPFQLSGGQQRLCAIAGVVAMRTQVIVFDEPTAGLDPSGRTRVRKVIDDILASGTTVVEVTHSMDDAALADQVIVLANGNVLANGKPADIFATEREGLLREHGLGAPLALALARRLEAAGMPMRHAPLTMDSLVDAILDELQSHAEGGRAGEALPSETNGQKGHD